MRYLLFLIVTATLTVNAQDLKVLRLEYPTATLDMHTVDTLEKSLSNISKNDDATFVAYKGALLTVKAKFTKVLKDKKTFFKEGVSYLEKAISNAPKNLEIRCLRLGVQENSPKIVGYKDSINEDKQFILDNFKSVSDPEIKKFISDYARISKVFSAAEKQSF